MKTVSYAMTAPGKPMERRERPNEPLGPGDVRVKVAGCGVCHTDLSFWSGKVKTNRALPLVLGHEIAGVVIDAGAGCEGLLQAEVIIPAVLPCGHCDLCRGGRANACRAQKMPGNDIDGGFASHLVVSGASVVRVGEPVPDHELWELAVIADAVTTPYQALERARVTEGDVAIVVGLGGLGAYGVQLAAARGATVFGVDVDRTKLQRLEAYGLARGFDASAMDGRALKSELARECAQRNLPSLGWKVFEMSGTVAGQEMAFGLLTHTGTLGVVGFTPEKASLRLSNLMAFDATAIGNWGCDPVHYPAVIDLVRQGKIQLRPFLRRFELQRINEVLEQVTSRALTQRPILVP